MKAIICTSYGPPEVLQLREVKKPIPKHHEVSIKIHATTVTGSDVIIRRFELPIWHPQGLVMRFVLGFGKPRNPILGLVLAGEIESVGKNVNRFHIGDEVYAFTMMRFGTYAEFICLPESSILALKPTNTTFAEAAAVPYGGLLALHYVKKLNIQDGHNVLIYGASGAIGTSAVQLAKYFGAEVSGICSTPNIELVKSLGADQVIDYTQEDFTSRNERYDFILDCVPHGKINRKQLKTQCAKALKPNGQHISIDDGTPKSTTENLMRLTELVETGHFRPVIDKVYPLEQMVEAHRYVDTGRKKGNVVITVTDNPPI